MKRLDGTITITGLPFDELAVGAVVYVNSVACVIAGRTAQEAIAEPWPRKRLQVTQAARPWYRRFEKRGRR